MNWRTHTDYRVYLVTDRSLCLGRPLEDVVYAAVRGGAGAVQLREKHASSREFLELARALVSRIQPLGIPLIINDRVDIALAIGAEGVHVGQSDMEAGDVRKKLGPDKIIGVSAQTVEQALKAQSHGADYLGVGAVFPTGSKADAVEVSHETVKAICEAVDIPVIAIGGITAENVAELAGTGICGIAVISAVFAQKDIKGAAQHLKSHTEEMLKVQQ